jgi:hypothetical protein
MLHERELLIINSLIRAKKKVYTLDTKQIHKIPRRAIVNQYICRIENFTVSVPITVPNHTIPNPDRITSQSMHSNLNHQKPMEQIHQYTIEEQIG